MNEWAANVFGCYIFFLLAYLTKLIWALFAPLTVHVNITAQHKWWWISHAQWILQINRLYSTARVRKGDQRHSSIQNPATELHIFNRKKTAKNTSGAFANSMGSISLRQTNEHRTERKTGFELHRFYARIDFVLNIFLINNFEWNFFSGLVSFVVLNF